MPPPSVNPRKRSLSRPLREFSMLSLQFGEHSDGEFRPVKSER